MPKETIDKNKGITLIALVVTIIVLLILAGISISMLTGQNGVLTRAAETKTKTEDAEKQENARMQGYEDAVREYTDGLPKTDYTKPYYPSSEFFKKEGDLSTGLVIQDKEGNQYVWIEVPKTLYDNESYNTETTNGDKKPNPGEVYTEDDYNNIEYCLKKYTAYYSDSSHKDIYAEDTTIQNGWFAGDSEYNIAKQKMLKSVYENGGFWVGRYEAGIEKESNVRTSNKEGIAKVPNLIPVTKQNTYPYNYVTRTQAKVLAEKVGGEKYTSSLMFGIQWDLMLKFIEEKEVENAKDTEKETTRTNIKSALRSTSKYNNKYIGNYYDNLWNITNKNAKYSLNSGNSFIACSYQKTSNASVLLTTGADESFSLINIYDMAGNVWEWTLEFYSASYPCTYRGGSYNRSASGYPARHVSPDTSSSNNNVGFRVGLWK